MIDLYYACNNLVAVPKFGDGQAVIKEVIMDENVVTALGCTNYGEFCYSSAECCAGLTCRLLPVTIIRAMCIP